MTSKIQIKIKIGFNKEPLTHLKASKGRLVADPKLFLINDPSVWEEVYNKVIDPKYSKYGRKFSTKWTGPVQDKEPMIYLIPRQRGGGSYKKYQLTGAKAEDLQYALISKGFGM